MGPIKCLEKAGAVASICTLVGGCQNLGAIAIDQGRDRYNSVLQSTAKVQTLANIVRVASHDSTSFIDVAEVDASTTLTGTGGGTVAGIGSKPASYGLLGTLTGGATYTEQPVVKYVPLTGSGLVAQVARPLTVDAIVSLVTSNWPAVAVLDLTASSITPDQQSAFAALNIIASLTSGYHASLVAGKTDLTSPPKQAQQQNASNEKSSPPANDTLILFIRPSKTENLKDREDIDSMTRRLGCLYNGTQKTTSDHRIELRTEPVPDTKLKGDLTNGAPFLQTLTGIGILKNATERPAPKIRIVSRDEYETIRSNKWNNPNNNPNLDVGFYTLLKKEQDRNPNDNPSLDTKKKYRNLLKRVENSFSDPTLDDDTLSDKLLLYEPDKGNKNTCSDEFIYGNTVLGLLRRYILIIRDDIPPANAYVAYPYQGRWYYIDGDDEISKKNFNLISLLLTVMSVPSTTTPITTSISLGP